MTRILILLLALAWPLASVAIDAEPAFEDPAMQARYEALTHEHLPFDVVEYEHLPGLLSKYRVVMLPNLACLDDDTAQILDRYVAGGGHLVATHETGLYDAEGRPRAANRSTGWGRRSDPGARRVGRAGCWDW